MSATVLKTGKSYQKPYKLAGHRILQVLVKEYHFYILQPLLDQELQQVLILQKSSQQFVTNSKTATIMRAVQVTGTKAHPVITLAPSLPKPTPKDDELLIKVHAAGITADELSWSELWDLEPRIPGHDISGTVEALGDRYTTTGGSLSVGDEVYGMIHAWRGGLGQAEYVIVRSEEVARKPRSVSHAQAAALPIPVLTACEALEEHVEIRAGMRVLVTGASGAVGLIMVQLVSQRAGVEVIALASSQHHETLKALGASQVVDYQTPNWEDSISDVDVVLDTVGDPILAKTWKTIKNSNNSNSGSPAAAATILTVAEPPPAWDFGQGQPEELTAHPGTKWIFFIVAVKSDALEKMARLVDDGTVKPLEVERFPVETAVEAWEFAGRRGRKGKVVIEFVS